MENEIRTIVGKSPDEVMRKFIDREIDDDDLNTFTGIVINNNDPDRDGKCQIRVFSMFDNIPDTDLPWAMGDQHFIGSKKGSFVVPSIGAIVSVYFDRGDIYLPHYTNKKTDRNNLPYRRMRNYPNGIVFFETDNGDYLELDRESSRFSYTHKTGTQITIDTNGNVTIDCQGPLLNITGKDTCSINGEKTTNLGGNFQVLYSTTGTIPTDANGSPIQGIGLSSSTTVGL